MADCLFFQNMSEEFWTVFKFFFFIIISLVGVLFFILLWWNFRKALVKKPNLFSETEIVPSEDCSICMEKVKLISYLPCGHVFHSACISEWLLHHDSCPLCRMSMC